MTSPKNTKYLITFLLSLFLSPLLLQGQTQGRHGSSTNKFHTAELKKLPSGIIHSAGPSIKGRAVQAASYASSLDYVSGTLIRISWRDIHTAPGEFDFSTLDKELDAAGERGKIIHLMITDGDSAPDWLKKRCKVFNFKFRRTHEAQICLPWDKTYQQYKRQLLKELAKRTDSDTRLGLIYMTYAAMSNGAEMHFTLSREEFENFEKCGYSPQKLQKSYLDVMDMYLNLFKKTPLAFEVHKVFDSPALAEAAWRHAQQKRPNRVCVAAWWACKRLAMGQEAEVFKIWQQAANQSCGIIQCVGNFTNQSYRFDSNFSMRSGKKSTLDTRQAFEQEKSFWQSQNAASWEIWAQDLENTDEVFKGKIKELAGKLKIDHQSDFPQ